MLEALEERRLPSLFTVTNLHNAGAGSLRQAIQRANTAAGADTIQFAAGLTGTIRLTSGELTIHDQVNILGPATGRLAVSGNHLSRVFNIDGRATIVNLSIIEGNAPAGGGVLNMGFLKLNNVVMTDNSAVNGGAVLSGGGSGGLVRFTVINSKLANNSAFAKGGAVFNGIDSTAFIRNTTITTNQCRGDGAGIYNDNMATMTIVTSTVAHNICRRTGLGGTGGGIDNAGTLTILASTIASNLAQHQGGGILSGGALYIINSTIANNTALGAGIGGISTLFGSSLSISNSTITGNVDASGVAGRTGGISFQGGASFTLNNTVVAENFGTSSPDIRATAISGSGNFIGSGDGLVGIADGANGNRVGTVAAPLDPKLGPLENNGGRTLTRLPRPGSPLINAGVNAVLATGITTDQRGFRRIKFGIVDIGAVEFGATS
jgi:hypothetical protein